MTTKKRLEIFQPEEHEQSRFFDSLEELLDSLHEKKWTPDRVHSIVNNTRTWMALIIVETAT